MVLRLTIYSLFQDAEGVCDTLDYCRNSLIQLLLSFKTGSAENVCDTDQNTTGTRLIQSLILSFNLKIEMGPVLVCDTDWTSTGTRLI